MSPQLIVHRGKSCRSDGSHNLKQGGTKSLFKTAHLSCGKKEEGDDCCKEEDEREVPSELFFPEDLNA